MTYGKSEIYSFGEWMKHRQQQLHLTQQQLATAAYCSLIMIKKIEADERRPSTELALTLAAPLQIPRHLWTAFNACARGEQPVDYLYQMDLDKGQAVAGKREPQRLTLNATRLPQDSTPFLGRETELTDIIGTLRRPECRLLSLVGPGGIGKTRLAIEAARKIADELIHGAAFVNLSLVSDPARIPDAIAEALALLSPGPASDYLPKLLARHEMLMVLDNCEQLSQELGWLSAVLTAAPGITLLATSRAQLQLTEEWVMPVAGLEAAELLFEQTARRLDPGFDLTTDAAEVGRVCGLVGNLPLAVELAAGWTSLLSCAQIADRIQNDLTILSTTLRNVPPRHRSMKAVIDQSWQLLSEEEQIALMRLSVFQGGWMTYEAETVAGANLDLLRGLKQKTLVQTVSANRFDLHSLVRQYAAEKLTLAGLKAYTHRNHFDAFLLLGSQLDAQLHGSQALESLQRFWLEKDNIWAALQWSLDSEGPDLTLTMLQFLWPYWLNEGAYKEGQRWTERVITESSEDSILLCLALTYLSDYHALLGEFDRAVVYHARAQELAERLASPEVQLQVLISTIQGSQTIDAALRDSHKAIKLIEETEELFFYLPEIYNYLGRWLQTGGRFDEAQQSFQQSVSLYRKMGNILKISYPLSGLGQLALQAGDLQTAYKYSLESISFQDAKLEMVPWSSQGGIALKVSARLAMIRFYFGEIEQAEVQLLELLQQAEETDNVLTEQQILCFLSEIYLEKREFEKASFYFQSSLLFIKTLYQRLESVSLADHQPEVALFNVIETCLRAAFVTSSSGQHERSVILYSTADAFRHQSGQRNGHPLWNKGIKCIRDAKTHLAEDVYADAWGRGQQSSLQEALARLLQMA